MSWKREHREMMMYIISKLEEEEECTPSKNNMLCDEYCPEHCRTEVEE